MENRKKTILQAVICIGLLCVIWGGYYLANYFIKLNKHRQITICEDDFSWVYQVDLVESTDKKAVLYGFAFQMDRDAVEDGFEIVLHDIESGKNYFPEMEYVKREDVNEYFLCEFDYLQSGFKATIKGWGLDPKDKTYEVLLRVMGEKKAYQTGLYISDGELWNVNPIEFEPLEVDGTDLEMIIKGGKLRVYCPEQGMYVYQYNGELYWIAEEDYGFREDGSTYVQFQIDTTQVDKLPEARLKNEWYWDNISFDFCNNELLDCRTGKYRVAKQGLPEEYSIVKILTGNYDKEWIWQKEFRPFYQFEDSKLKEKQ